MSGEFEHQLWLKLRAHIIICKKNEYSSKKKSTFGRKKKTVTKRKSTFVKRIGKKNNCNLLPFAIQRLISTMTKKNKGFIPS